MKINFGCNSSQSFYFGNSCESSIGAVSSASVAGGGADGGGDGGGGSSGGDGGGGGLLPNFFRSGSLFTLLAESGAS